MSDLTEPLNSYASSEKKKAGSFPMWIALGISVLSMLICGVITYIFTKEHFAPTNPYNPSERYEIPARYEVSAVLRIPYLGEFKQPIYAKVDTVSNQMQLSYFSGSNTFSYNAAENGTNYAVVPMFDKLQCYRTFHLDEQELPNLFPYLPSFTKTDKQEVVNGVKCDVWTYSYINKVEKDGWVAHLPDERGYSGDYTFYVNAENGMPVALYTVGHNVLLGGSHTDEYWMDYNYVRAVDSVDADAFQPPFGMICEDSITPWGPTIKSRAAFTSDLAAILSDPKHAAFAQYTAAHGKVYTGDEYARRLGNFLMNQRYIDTVNKSGKKYTLKANHFADMSDEEKRFRLGRKKTQLGDPTTSACGKYTPSGKELPKSVDWRAKGYVTELTNDQGSCGSCWTYGLTGTIEGQIAAKTGKVIPVSQQHWMDCSAEEGTENGIEYGGNLACNGGLDYAGLTWSLLRNKGRIPSFDDYGATNGGYLNVNNFCHFYEKTDVNPFTGKTIEPVAVLDSCTHVNDAWIDETVSQEDRVNTLLDALANVGSVSVSIAVSQDLYYYKSGVYDDLENCGSRTLDLDHTVLAVGYETDEAGNIAVIIRNSWSDVWGEQGYAKILVKSADGKVMNVCGVATSPLFVTLK